VLVSDIDLPVLGSPEAERQEDHRYTLRRSLHFLACDSLAKQVMTMLSALLGHGASHERLAHLEDVMRPMYMVLPNRLRGTDQAMGRCALNRCFLALARHQLCL